MFIYFYTMSCLFFKKMYDDYMLCKVTLGVLKGAVTLKLYWGRKLYRPTSSVVDNLTTDLIGLSVAGQVSKTIHAYVAEHQIT